MRNVIPILLTVIVLSGCVDNAPHDNPLDPESSNYVKEGTFGGRIMIENQNSGVSRATVWDITEGVAVLTDTSGYFSFGSLKAGEHRFVTAKSNYTNDTFLVSITAGTTQQVTRYLNGAPVVTAQQILTRKIDQYFPSPQYFVDVTASVSDPNGIADLDSVWFGFDSLRYPLTYSVATKNFHATIYKYDIPTNTIQYLVGKALFIYSRDIKQAMSVSPSFFVTRVIENEATPVSPSPFVKDTVSADSIIFKWTPPSVTYNYSYNLTLSRVDAGTQTVVWTHNGLNSFFEELPYDGAVKQPSGNYVWTVTVVDDFGNYGRSKESAFVIK
jgi:hypothetical protein